MRSNKYKKVVEGARSSLVILSYKIKHSYDVSEFLKDYRYLLQRVIESIWDNVKWVERKQRDYYVIKQGRRKIKKYYYAKRLIPTIPKSKEFNRGLRDALLENWGYASHYVDSAIETAYSILNSWRKNYLRGRRRRDKPVVKREFVRVKGALYVYRNGKIRITIKPRELYLKFDLSGAWFKRRVREYDLGELVLKEDRLIITFRKLVKDKVRVERIGWDLNKCSMDGYSPRYSWMRIDLGKLYHIHRVHEIRRKKAQSIASKKHSVKLKASRHGKREGNRARDYVHKLTTWLAEAFPNALHGFEDLDKRGMHKNRRSMIEMLLSRTGR